jgi:hypothetical protein
MTMSETNSTVDPEPAEPSWFLTLLSLAMIAALAWWFLIRGEATEQPAPVPAAAHAAELGTR